MAKRAKKKKSPASQPSRKPAAWDWKLIFKTLALIAVGVWIYWPALGGDWLWDDDFLVLNNTELRDLHGLGQIWFSPPATDYWPLTWTLLWIEWHLWGAQPLGFHLASLALHLTSGFLLWRLLHRLGLRWAWTGGFLFVIHPLVVESVAWISEIKNTLSLPFFLLSATAWLEAEQGRKQAYQKSVLYYLAAMLSKTSTVALPVTLLLYRWWKRGEITRDDLRKMIPYVAIAVALGISTIYFQSTAAEVGPVHMGGFFERVLTAGSALCFYFGKFLLPVDLLPIYPRPHFNPPSLLQIVTIPLLVLAFVGSWINRKTWGRHVIFGVGFFALNLLPVLGFLRMTFLDISWVADHFAYLPMIGLIGLVAAGLEIIELRLRGPLRLYGGGLVAIAAGLLAWESHTYAGLFLNHLTLWPYTIQRNPEAWAAYNNLGKSLMKERRVAEAAIQFEQAARLNPDDYVARDNLGVALADLDRVSDSIAQLSLVVQSDPTYAAAHYNLGNSLEKVGRVADAINEYQTAVQLQPDFALAYNNLAAALYEAGRKTEAIAMLQQGLKIEPDNAIALGNLQKMESEQKTAPAK